MQQITLTLDLTAENLEKLKIFCEDTKAVPTATVETKKAAVKSKVVTKTDKKEKADAEKQEEAKTAKETAKVLTITDVRAVALKISKAGKSDKLKEIFAKFEATKLSEVPEDRYDELMEELVAVDA